MAEKNGKGVSVCGGGGVIEETLMFNYRNKLKSTPYSYPNLLCSCSSFAENHTHLWRIGAARRSRGDRRRIRAVLGLSVVRGCALCGVLGAQLAQRVLERLLQLLTVDVAKAVEHVDRGEVLEQRRFGVALRQLKSPINILSMIRGKFLLNCTKSNLGDPTADNLHCPDDADEGP